MSDLEFLARMDWVILNKGITLHALRSAEVDKEEWEFRQVTTECGMRSKRAFIPGSFDRFSTPRCDICCEKTGMPYGYGSPKNDSACRGVLGL